MKTTLLGKTQLTIDNFGFHQCQTALSKLTIDYSPPTITLNQWKPRCWANSQLTIDNSKFHQDKTALSKLTIENSPPMKITLLGKTKFSIDIYPSMGNLQKFYMISPGSFRKSSPAIRSFTNPRQSSRNYHFSSVSSRENPDFSSIIDANATYVLAGGVAWHPNKTSATFAVITNILCDL